MDFRLPPLGEGIDSATVVNVLVKPGDAVAAGQPVVEVETDKASMAVESDQAGTVEAVLAQPGAKITIGAPLLRLQGSGAAKSAAPVPPPPAAAKPADAPKAIPASPPTPSGNGPAAATEFKLPQLGEGIDSATVVNVLVKPGDAVTAGQPVIEVETDKASMAVEADAAGTVTEVLVQAGAKVRIGAPILTLQGGGAAKSAGDAPARSAPAAEARRSPGPAPAPAVQQSTPAGRAAVQPATANGSGGAKALVPAGPATRRLARELGVNLAGVPGSARGGRVTVDDVKGYVRARMAGGGAAAPAGGTASGSIVDAFTLPPLPDFAKFGEVERKPVARIRETIAKNLTVAWRTMPMVTQHDLADITDLEAGRKRIVEGLPKGAPKVTMTVLAVKAVVAALKEFPQFCASYDMNAGELVLKKYFHVGIAVDTERGLVVPVIRDADKKSIRDLAAEVAGLAEKARTGKLGIDEMRGGCFTITNLGGIGGTSFTPIVNYPEVAILGLSRSALQPVVKDGQIVPRLMMPMSLTYDHRVIDGADGARFTTRLAQLFSDPIRLLMES